MAIPGKQTEMLEKQKLKWLYGACGFFIALNALFIYNEFYWFTILPVALLLIGLALFSIDKLLMFIVCCTPLSLNLENLEFGFGLYLPTEPLMFGAMLVFLVKQFFENTYDLKILRHPIAIAIVINLVWLGMTCITSELPLVSFKFLLARLWFVICFFFIAVQIFKRLLYIRSFLWLYIIPLTVVVLYTIVRHAGFGFDVRTAHFVMQPFFKDHTSYGAILALFSPFLIGVLFSKRIPFNLKMITAFLLIIFAAGIVFSYTRATWASLLAALVVLFIFLFKIKLRTVLLTCAVLAGVLLYFRNDITMQLERNKQESSSDLAEHVKSISNIASDASNIERLNRWNCAWKMFLERPVFGWGPGTYMFLYAPFQESEDKTVISTNFGDRGNAHSEYLGPMAEAGMLGMFTFLAIVLLAIYRAAMLYRSLKDRELKILILSVLLGLVTYLTHGLLNNFLDSDKASVPFWGFIAIIVAFDLYHKTPSPKKENKSI